MPLLPPSATMPMAARPESIPAAKKIDPLRVPPHSIEAEQAVLGGLMLSAEAWDKVADRITEQDFYRRDHALIFRAIGELSNKGMPADAVTLGEWFEAQGIAERRRFSEGRGAASVEFLACRFARPSGSATPPLEVLWAWSGDGDRWEVADNPRLSFAGHPVLYKVYVVLEGSSPQDKVIQEFLGALLPALRSSLS